MLVMLVILGLRGRNDPNEWMPRQKSILFGLTFELVCSEKVHDDDVDIPLVLFMCRFLEQQPAIVTVNSFTCVAGGSWTYRLMQKQR